MILIVSMLSISFETKRNWNAFPVKCISIHSRHIFGCSYWRTHTHTHKPVFCWNASTSFDRVHADIFHLVASNISSLKCKLFCSWFLTATSILVSLGCLFYFWWMFLKPDVQHSMHFSFSIHRAPPTIYPNVKKRWSYTRTQITPHTHIFCTHCTRMKDRENRLETVEWGQQFKNPKENQTQIYNFILRWRVFAVFSSIHGKTNEA